jgi:hypothetical protein
MQLLQTNRLSMQDTGRKILRWLFQTPGQTFVLAVIAVELALHRSVRRPVRSW